MRINSIQNYTTNRNSLKQNNRNQSFGHIVMIDAKRLQGVNNFLDSNKFSEYIEHFKNLQGVKLNLHQIMQEIPRWNSFETAGSHLSVDAYRKGVKDIVNSFLKAIGKEEANDYTLRLIPYKTGFGGWITPSNNYYVGKGIAPDINHNIEYNLEKSKSHLITSDMIDKYNVELPEFDYSSHESEKNAIKEVEFDFMRDTDWRQYFLLPKDGKELKELVRLMMYSHLEDAIVANLEKLNAPKKEKFLQQKANEFKNLATELCN